jgi:hypothetical protein
MAHECDIRRDNIDIRFHELTIIEAESLTHRNARLAISHAMTIGKEKNYEHLTV